jgi:hypothetical protein
MAPNLLNSLGLVTSMAPKAETSRHTVGDARTTVGPKKQKQSNEPKLIMIMIMMIIKIK